MKLIISSIFALIFIASSCTELIIRTDATDSELKAELLVLRKRAALVEKKNAVLEAENIDDKSEIKRLRNDYTVFKDQSGRRIRELTETNEKHKAAFIETVKRIEDESRKREKDLSDRLAATVKEYDRKEKGLLGAITVLEKSMAEKAAALAQKEKTVNDLNAEISGLKTEIKSRDDAIALNNKKLKELLSDLDGKKAELDKSRSELESATSERNKTRSELDAIKSEFQKRESALQDREKTIQELKNEIDSIKALNKENNP